MSTVTENLRKAIDEPTFADDTQQHRQSLEEIERLEAELDEIKRLASKIVATPPARKHREQGRWSKCLVLWTDVDQMRRLLYVEDVNG